MTDPNTGSDLVPVETAQGPKELPRLTPADMVRLKNRIRRERKDELRANLKETGLTGEPACRMLNEFDSRQIDRYDVVTYGLLPEGVAEVVPMAWLHTYGPVATEEAYAEALARAKAEVEAWGVSPKEMTRAAAGALYVDLKPAKPAEGQGAGGPLAESGEGSPTPITSATHAA